MSISNTITENNEIIPAITDPTINEFPIISKWDDLNLPDKILQGIYGYGFEKAGKKCAD